MNHMKKGLLAVSFGTSVNETREKTIDAIERELAAACPDCQLYRAWTSRMIIRKLKQRDQVQIDTVKEAFARMLADGITEVMVQPTHVIKGIENEQMMEEIRSFSEHFEKISVGEPLLSSEEDFRNPTGSVFCAHGSGYVVPWDEVSQHMHLPYVYNGDESEEALSANARTQNTFSAEDAETIAGNRRRASWEKEVSKMSSVELDAELADVYAREFGMSKNDVADQERRKWSGRKKNEYDGLSGKPRTVKHDKHGNPIYPKKAPDEEYIIVDGYNIIFAWDDLKELSRINIDSARDKLKDILSDYQGYRGCKLILVFDAYKVKGNAGKHETYHNIEVVYTKQDETADAFIEKMVFGIRDKYKVTVATSDGLEQQTVMSLGALRMSAGELKTNIELTRRMGLDEFHANK